MARKLHSSPSNFYVFVLILLILLVCFGIFYFKQGHQGQLTQQMNPMMVSFMPSYPYNNLNANMPGNVLQNPYSPPLRDERYVVPELVPINVSTNIGAVPDVTPYRQLGIITPLNGASKDNILPLMGRPLFTSRDKWQYYTISNQHNNVKLPISFKGRSALNDNGVDKIYNGDTIYVEGYDDTFKATIYENDTIKYLPFV